MRSAVSIICLALSASCLCATTEAQTTLYTMTGSNPGDQLGLCVAGPTYTTSWSFDIDQDGVPDFLVGTPNPNSLTGEVRVFSGATGGELTAFHKTGTAAGDRFGKSVACLGDVNADGYPDFVVGANGDTASVGHAFVYSGKDGNLIFQFDGNTAGFQFGGAVACAGDVDGDGVCDVLVGAKGSESPQLGPGYVKVFSGKTGAELLSITRGGKEDLFGATLIGLGDLNQDGHCDFAVGAPSATPPDSKGHAWILSGKDGSDLWHQEGSNISEYFGASLAALGDVDDDGVPDFAVGSPSARPDPGFVTIFSGKTFTALQTLIGTVSGGEFGYALAGLGDVDGDGVGDEIVGCRLGGPNKEGEAIAYLSASMSSVVVDGTAYLDQLGFSVAAAGDVNHDGFADVIIGAPTEDANGAVDSGAVRVVAVAECNADASWSNYGSGFPGYHGVPTIVAASDPVLGKTVTVDISCSAKKPTYYYFFAGLDSVDLPTHLGGDFLVGAVFLAFGDGISTAGASIDGDIPDDPSLCGLHVYCQALELDPNAAKGVSFTPGLDLLLGH